MASIAPDLDLFVGFFDGRIRHQGAVHSLGFALAVAGIVLASAFCLRSTRPWSTAGIVGLAWILHIMTDYLAEDRSAPFGPQALWPWSYSHYAFPWPVFRAVGRDFDWNTIRQNTLTIAWEMAMIFPLFVLVWRLKTRRLRVHEHRS
jgi:inner membrane protein